MYKMGYTVIPGADETNLVIALHRSVNAILITVPSTGAMVSARTRTISVRNRAARRNAN